METIFLTIRIDLDSSLVKPVLETALEKSTRVVHLSSLGMSMDEKISTPNTDELLDGGDVKTPGSPQVKVEDHDSKNRGLLAQFLIAILAGLFVMHYVFIFVLEWNGKKDPKTLEAAFNASLPIISGLVASAVTYYFTRGDKNS